MRQIGWADGDWDIQERMQGNSLATGAKVPATGLSNGTGALVAADGSFTEIDASLTGALAARTTSTDVYYKTLLGANIKAQLQGLEGTTIYELVWFGTNATSDLQYARWEPLLVVKNANVSAD